MQKWLAVMLVVSLAMGVGVNGHAAMRCGNLMVQEGTDSLEVQSECGAPVSKEKFYLEKYGEVDKWVYGPEAGYLYVVYIFGGKVVEIEEIQQ